MPATTSPFFGINYGWTTGEASWGDPVNSNFKVLSFLGKGAVDAFVAALPVSPSEGASVVLTTDKQFYVRIGGVWLFITPQIGMEVNETSTGKRWQYTGTWVEILTTSALKTDLANSVSPSKGAGMVGWSRAALTSTPTTAHQMFDAQSVNIWEYANLATGYVAGGSPSSWDWWPAIEAAGSYVMSAGGGEVYFPPVSTYYRITAPIFMKSGVTYCGDGSLIFNDRATSTIFGDQMVFLPGAFANDFYNALTYNAISNVVAGETTITLTTPGDAARYSVGDTIILRDNASIVPSAVTPSLYMRFNVVTAKAGAVISLLHPHDKSFAAVSISLTDNETNFYALPGIPQQKCYVAVNSGLRNLRIKTFGFWTGATAALSCNFDKIEVLSARALIYGNSYQRCSFTNISGGFQRILYEIASNSFMTTVKNVKANRIPGDTNETNIAIFNENSESIHISEVDCNMDSAVSLSQLVSFFQSADCSLKNAVFRCAGWRGTLIASNLSSGLCLNGLVENVTFYASPAAAYGIDLLGAGFIKDFKVKGNNFYGASFVGGAGRLSATGCKINGNKFEAVTAFQLQSSASDNRVENNGIPGGFTATSGVLQDIIANNTFAENKSTRTGNIKKAALLLPAPLSVTSTTTGNIVASRTLPAPSFSNTIVSTLKIVVRGNMVGATATKDVAIAFGGTVIGSIPFLAAESGRFSIELDYKPNQNGGAYYQRLDKAGVLTSVRSSLTGLDFSVNNYNIDLQAWVGGASNSITIDDFEIIPTTII